MFFYDLSCTTMVLQIKNRTKTKERARSLADKRARKVKEIATLSKCGIATGKCLPSLSLQIKCRLILFCSMKPILHGSVSVVRYGSLCFLKKSEAKSPPKDAQPCKEVCFQRHHPLCPDAQHLCIPRAHQQCQVYRVGAIYIRRIWRLACWITTAHT
jgi:hypothetical protein